ncbi:hypothetical protein B0T26DRAFT_755826 [Lasiosphaeria miniovina]|uniref:Uncharacterized protein n=1 Tax=Lasiosphaeria miniovina TaxID=1954250 RepID=A0AA40DNG7_9PEZI|nr:uncharacterized protein B0T26DRAFT_755826 [Lasiosphaeria miniovina]KAK0706308.1 hypothetical protein B0T26DRAFT_755826 [Lasiosphaeria miniovina]
MAKDHSLTTSSDVIILNSMEMDDEDDSLGDNALVLTRDQLQQVEDFRNRLLNKTDDAEKLELCAEKRNELLRHNTELQILVATYDDVMSAACHGYENKKRETASKGTLRPTGRHKKLDNNLERDEWECYFGIATSAAQVKSKCLAALKAVAKRWGREVTLHYEWESRGEKFYNLLRASALKLPEWNDTARALTIIMCQRHNNIKRACIVQSRDPIMQADLRELGGMLGNTRPPNTDRSRGLVDALFLTGVEAASFVEYASLSVPIIAEGQQQFQWNTNDRPIAQLFKRMTHFNRTVSVQIPSRSPKEDSFENRARNGTTGTR